MSVISSSSVWFMACKLGAALWAGCVNGCEIGQSTPLRIFGRENHGRGINTERQHTRLGSSGTFLRQIQLIGHPSQIRQRSCIHLSHDLDTASFYCNLTDADVVGDLLVEAAGHHQGHYLALAEGEGLEPRAQCGGRLLIL